jgi:hypothetical protein
MSIISGTKPWQGEIQKINFYYCESGIKPAFCDTILLFSPILVFCINIYLLFFKMSKRLLFDEYPNLGL